VWSWCKTACQLHRAGLYWINMSFSLGCPGKHRNAPASKIAMPQSSRPQLRGRMRYRRVFTWHDLLQHSPCAGTNGSMRELGICFRVINDETATSCRGLDILRALSLTSTGQAAQRTGRHPRTASPKQADVSPTASSCCQ
jgi:hypothetical protein